MFDLAVESWRDLGREGNLRLVACLYYTLGPKADRRGDYIRRSYSFLGPGADDMVRAIPPAPEAVANLIGGFGELGANEVVCWTTVAELEQLYRLAAMVG
jgi:hypothetical protein